MAADAVMVVRDLHKTYVMGEVEVPVLRGVHFEIRAAEMMVVLGESGSGKSTLMNLIGGIDSPTAGTLHFEGRDIGALQERELTRFRREHVGFVFQFYNLVPTLTAVENVRVAAEIAVDPQDPLEMLQLVGLEDRADHFPSQLSGGQQQRVAIARALAGRPKIMLCDEPTGALDHETSLFVLDLLQGLSRQTGTSVIMITHARPIAGMADRVLYLADGVVEQLVENEAPRAAKDLDW